VAPATGPGPHAGGCRCIAVKHGVQYENAHKPTPKIRSTRAGVAVTLSSTAYCQGTITASGEPPFVGEVANNTWPLGTRLSVSPPVWGRTRFVVEDRIGSGSQLDFYNPSCTAAIDFGRRLERVTVIR
jgi:3D (Asp-Asp-Asp) domain-containing protein